ncbi:hypothetical protein ACP4OV_023299 [Aristida adscensionis]
MEAAVVTVSHGAMGSLLAKLAALLTDKYKLAKEAKGRVLFLKAELESMYAFLYKMSDTEEPDMQDKCWANEVRELSYDIEDSVNEFMLRVERKSNSKPHGFKGFMERSMNLLTTMNTRNKTAKEFEDLERRVKEVNDRRLRYEVHNTISKPTNTTVDLRLLALHAETVALVGIEGPRDELIQLIDKEAASAHELKVLSIVGFGGLGKTTLANEIYRKLEGQYQCRAFVPVSQRPNVRKILRTILSQVGFKAHDENSNMETWDEHELIYALHEFLLDKRYFIVIDDIWDASAWEIIRSSLPKNRNRSKVITTTRIEGVARACCANHYEYIYRMKQLSDQDSRRLFFNRIFGSEDACPPYLKEISAKILKKCGGLPLAIISTSSLLANEPNKWEYVFNSLGSSLEVSPSLEGMRQILNLSYIHLPHYLKTCMLYLGIYPEDYTIKKDDLARQWVAEGFISKVHGVDLEDIAKSYFNELINRSMIQPTKTDYNGEVLSCRVHDMMLDLILYKAGEGNFITTIDDIQGLIVQRGKIRRLMLHLAGTVDEMVAGSVQLSQIRALARFGNSRYLPPFLLFKHLRVLTVDISYGGYKQGNLLDFSGVGHLFQLRYLKIAAYGVHVVLPSNIGVLQQLETFEVHASEISSKAQPSQELPSDYFVHLSRLLHLIVPFYIELTGIGNMKSLRTLHRLRLHRDSLDSVKGLGELTSLTDLRLDIYFDPSSDELEERCREIVACLGKLCNLRYLELDLASDLEKHWCLDTLSRCPASFCNLQRFYLGWSFFSRVPQWIGQLHKLYDLRIVVKDLLEDDIGMLAQLRSLAHLHLHIRGALKDRIIIGGSGFPALKDFRIGCSRISYLTFEAGAMAMLERLRLAFNAKGWDRCGAAPAGIEHLVDLKNVRIHIGDEGAKESNRIAAESALRDAIDKHPGCPTVEFSHGGWVMFDHGEFETEEQEEPTT